MRVTYRTLLLFYQQRLSPCVGTVGVLGDYEFEGVTLPLSLVPSVPTGKAGTKRGPLQQSPQRKSEIIVHRDSQKLSSF